MRHGGLVRPQILDLVLGKKSRAQLAAAVDVARMLSYLWRTPFGPPPGFEIELEAEMSGEPMEEWVDSIHLGRSVASPGDTVGIAVRLLADGGKYHTEQFELAIPKRWAGRKLAIFAAGADDADAIAVMAKGSPNPKNLKEIARWLKGLRQEGSLYLLVIADGVGLQAEVDTFSFIPGSAVVQLSGVPTRVPQSTGLKYETARERPGAVMGAEAAFLNVREN